ncbi:MAG: hypothetical protein ACE5JD_08555 [Candidatus Methylomirabilia bacterium]
MNPPYELKRTDTICWMNFGGLEDEALGVRSGEREQLRGEGQGEGAREKEDQE